MKTKRLGKTGFQISTMGYGCGGYWGLNVFDEKKAISLVRQAIDGGVNFFDTGASYSGGNAEIRLGKALKGIDTSNLIIGSKVGTIFKRGRLFKDYSREGIFSQVERSLINLGLESLPLLQLHGTPKQEIESVVETLCMLKKQGKVKMIGASCDGENLEQILSLNKLDVVMLTYNLIEKKAIRQINMAYEKDCGILIKSPMCHTLYSNNLFKITRLSDIWHLLRVLKNYRPMIIEGMKYRFINTFNNWSPHEIALLYALNDKVSCVVTGTTSLLNMQRNLETFAKALPAEIRIKIDNVV